MSNKKRDRDILRELLSSVRENMAKQLNILLISKIKSN